MAHSITDTSDPAFNAFWQRYPNKKAKLDAIKAWGQVKPDAAVLERIHAALDWQVNLPSWHKDGGQYVPLPATYLRGRRWDDEPNPALVPKERIDWQAECATLHSSRCTNAYFHAAMMAEQSEVQ